MEQIADLKQRMNKIYKTMSKGQKRIANYIDVHYDKAVDQTAARLGQTVGVSESTVVRFATELGYKGYPQFQKALEEMVKNKLNSIQRISRTQDRVEQQNILKSVLRADYENIKQTMEEITDDEFNKAVDLISGAENIYIVGGRSCQAVAGFFRYYLNYIFDYVKLVNSNGLTEALEDIHRISGRDVIIGISFPRYSKDTVRIMEYSRKKGAKVIALTDSMASPMVMYSQCHLFAKSDMASIADSLVAPLSVINALIAALSIRNRSKVEQTMHTLETIWDEYSVYKNHNVEETP